MPLIPCPECRREISDRATTCPHCGYPLVEPWSRRLERVWRQGFHHSWVAAAGMPLILVLFQFLRLARGGRQPDWGLLIPTMLGVAWVGFLAGLMAIAIAEVLRMHLPGDAARAGPWGWSRPAVVTLLVLYAMALVAG